jgi:hypothetical protein
MKLLQIAEVIRSCVLPQLNYRQWRSKTRAIPGGKIPDEAGASVGGWTHRRSDVKIGKK